MKGVYSTESEMGDGKTEKGSGKENGFDAGTDARWINFSRVRQPLSIESASAGQEF